MAMDQLCALCAAQAMRSMAMASATNCAVIPKQAFEAGAASTNTSSHVGESQLPAVQVATSEAVYCVEPVVVQLNANVPPLAVSAPPAVSMLAVSKSEEHGSPAVVWMGWWAHVM